LLDDNTTKEIMIITGNIKTHVCNPSEAGGLVYLVSGDRLSGVRLNQALRDKYRDRIEGVNKIKYDK
jgi:hypothetical protein